VTTPSRVDVLVVGDYYVDVVFAGAPSWPRPDAEVFADVLATVPGGAYTHALALHRLGVRTRWVTDFGTDGYSAEVLAAARAEGLDSTCFVHHDKPVRNISIAISRDGDRGFLSYRQPRPPLDVAPAVQAVRPRLVLLPHLLRGDEATAALAAAAAVGAEVFMECQHTDATLDTPGVTDTLARLHVFAPNAAEARQLTGIDDVTAATRRLAQLTPTVVVKNGAHGALAATGATLVHAAARPVAALDTTGAGDCFDAGFIYARLRGHDLATCLQLATACGALSTTDYGSAAAPTLAELAAADPATAASSASTA